MSEELKVSARYHNEKITALEKECASLRAGINTAILEKETKKLECASLCHQVQTFKTVMNNDEKERYEAFAAKDEKIEELKAELKKWQDMANEFMRLNKARGRS